MLIRALLQMKLRYKPIKIFDILLANQDGSVLWHCTAGKDRAGFGTALVLSALGVDKNTVIDDYMLSNKYRADENKKQLKPLQQKQIIKSD